MLFKLSRVRFLIRWDIFRRRLEYSIISYDLFNDFTTYFNTPISTLLILISDCLHEFLKVSHLPIYLVRGVHYRRSLPTKYQLSIFWCGTSLFPAILLDMDHLWNIISWHGTVYLISHSVYMLMSVRQNSSIITHVLLERGAP